MLCLFLLINSNKDIKSTTIYNNKAELMIYKKEEFKLLNHNDDWNIEVDWSGQVVDKNKEILHSQIPTFIHSFKQRRWDKTTDLKLEQMPAHRLLCSKTTQKTSVNNRILNPLSHSIETYLNKPILHFNWILTNTMYSRNTLN